MNPSAEEIEQMVHPSAKDLVAETEDLYRQGQWTQSIANLKRLMKMGAEDGSYSPAQCHHILGDCEMNLGRMGHAITHYREALRLDPKLRLAQENLVFLIDAQPWTTEKDAQRARDDWWQRFGYAAFQKRLTPTVSLDPEKRIRVGYVSCDFRFHSAAISWSSAIAFPSDQIEPVFYSTLPVDHYDHVTKRDWKERWGSAFVDVSLLTQECFAEVVHNDQIDILVDLSGWTAGNRLFSFAHKPAPIQVTGWGYATGVGNPSMDALFADPVVATPSMRARLHERVIDLPCVIGYNPRPDLPVPNPLPSLALNEGPIFGVFQRAMKTNVDTMAVWTKILKKVPESKLIFKGADYRPDVREWIVSEMHAVRGQVAFEQGGSHLDHMHWYQHIDLSLDPWPQTGGVSTMESCWMGVPCVTLIGDRVIQRTSASILTTLGLPEFITETRKDYIRTAYEMVTTKREWLNDVRLGLRTRMEQSPIITGYRECVEGHLRSLWRDYCAQQGASRG